MKYWYLIVVHILLMLVASNIGNDRVYFTLNALSWCLIPLWFYFNSYKNPIVIIWIAFTINNLVDELLLKTDYYNISEYIFAIFVIVLTIYKYVNRGNGKKCMGNNC